MGPESGPGGVRKQGPFSEELRAGDSLSYACLRRALASISQIQNRPGVRSIFDRGRWGVAHNMMIRQGLRDTHTGPLIGCFACHQAHHTSPRALMHLQATNRRVVRK
jgi:hypothetical protein